MAEHELILSLGGNLGNKAEIFSETREYIRVCLGEVETTSPIYETQPWGFESTHAFWNQIVIVRTGLSPDAVLSGIQKMEDRYGRTRETGRYLSRKMDIDILFYGSQVIDTGTLIIPHRLIAQRRFVLAPLADIRPLLEHPLTRKTILEMLEECTDTSEVKRLQII